MNRFSYRGVDAQGRETEGEIEAHDANGAIQRLTGRGVRVRRLQLVPQEAAGSPPPTAVSQAPRGPAPRPRPRRTAPAPQSGSAGSSVVRPPATVVRVPRASRQDQSIALFSLANLLKSGQSPAMALDTVAQTIRHPGLAAALSSAGQAAQSGLAPSEALRCYPDAVHDSVTGLMAAGEQGGFLPEAVQAAAQQAQDTARLARSFWWAWVIFVNALLTIPLVFWVGQSLVKLWDRYDPQFGGNVQANSSEAYSSTFLAGLVWPTLPAIVLLAVLSWLARAWWFAPGRRALRDRLGLRWPHFGARARYENLSVFTWTLARLSVAGISPERAWGLATEAVPNWEVRAILRQTGTRLREGTRLSEATQDPRLFPPEYVPMLRAGETSGDITSALDQLAQLQRGEMEGAEQVARWRGGRWGCAFGLATSGIAAIIFYRAWMVELPARVLEGLQ